MQHPCAGVKKVSINNLHTRHSPAIDSLRVLGNKPRSNSWMTWRLLKPHQLPDGTGQSPLRDMATAGLKHGEPTKMHTARCSQATRGVASPGDCLGQLAGTTDRSLSCREDLTSRTACQSMTVVSRKCRSNEICASRCKLRAKGYKTTRHAVMKTSASLNTRASPAVVAPHRP